jgi:glutathione S-transferase
MIKLYIGNKNYSSWSMRSWVLLKQAGIAFEEITLRFDSFQTDSGFAQGISTISPAGKVPVLVDGDLTVWDTLAIAEYLAEQFPDHGLWPRDKAQRARARSICAEMHAGFSALRSNCPMNIEASLPEVGARLWAQRPALRTDVARIITMWQSLLKDSPDGLLFGDFSIADAYFAPVCMRFLTYQLQIPDDVAAYVARVRKLPSVAAWVQGAIADHDFRPFLEPYRAQPPAPQRES